MIEFHHSGGEFLVAFHQVHQLDGVVVTVAQEDLGGRGDVAGGVVKKAVDDIPQRPDEAAISAAVDELIAAGVPFREADLGPGQFTVVYTRGPLLWQAQV